MTEDNANVATTKTPKIYYLILVILPFLLLAALELGLRLFNYGTSYPLFVPVAKDNYDNYLRPNPHILKRYFSHPSQAPAIAPQSFLFKKEKDNDTFRIVVQGGSSAAGFPYGLSGSLAVMLNQRFKRLYPDKQIEIISTAMAAINSYMILDFTDEIIAIDPDLVLIYAGHNEYLGIMGVGSAFASGGGHASNLLFLKLKDFKIVQLIQRIVYAFQHSDPDAGENETAPDINRNMMALAAKEKNIPFGSEMYLEGIEQFSNNLDLILERYQSKSIPVFLSTLASNEKDIEPFSSVQGEGSADSYYSLAKVQQSNGQYDQALANYILAKDHDSLRFRAPSIFNQLIKEKTNQSDVILVDAEAQFRALSPNRIIGDNLMLEHLHPTSEGYFVLADAFMNKLITEQTIAGNTEVWTREQLLSDSPINMVSNLLGDYRVKILKSDFPFTEQKQPVDLGPLSSFDATKAMDLLNNKNWLSVHYEMVDHYYNIKNDSEAAKVAALISDYYVLDSEIAILAGDIYMFTNDHRMALYYHKRALSLQPNNTKYLMSAVGSYLLSGNPNTSLELLNRVIELEPTNNLAKQQKARLLQLLNQ